MIWILPSKLKAKLLNQGHGSRLCWGKKIHTCAERRYIPKRFRLIRSQMGQKWYKSMIRKDKMFNWLPFFCHLDTITRGAYNQNFEISSTCWISLILKNKLPNEPLISHILVNSKTRTYLIKYKRKNQYNKHCLVPYVTAKTIGMILI